MKHTLLPFFLFSSAAAACYIPPRTVPVREQIAIRHPQANVNYYCQPGQSLEDCIDVACSYATQYSCRVISQTQNTYYIETYIPANYNPTFVVVPSPVVVAPTPVFYVAPFVSIYPTRNQTRNEHRVHHRPRRR